MQKVNVMVKGQGHRDQNKSYPILKSQMATKRCTKLRNGIEEVPYSFSRSSVKFQGHGQKKIDDLAPI